MLHKELRLMNTSVKLPITVNIHVNNQRNYSISNLHVQESYNDCLKNVVVVNNPTVYPYSSGTFTFTAIYNPPAQLNKFHMLHHLYFTVGGKYVKPEFHPSPDTGFKWKITRYSISDIEWNCDFEFVYDSIIEWEYQSVLNLSYTLQETYQPYTLGETYH